MMIRITWARVAAAVAAIGVAGMAFAWSGLFNLAASSGHWPITEWFLHWTMRNSVKTYSAITAPADPRDDSGMVSAAGLYAASCAACHGAPGVRPLPVMQAASPPAPDLSVNASEWTDRQLFWIVKHGVKYTGMPGWAAKDRDDEVRRMVGFVRALPGMSPSTYRMLTGGLPLGCAGCHGNDGMGRGQADIPILAGQDTGAMIAALRGYAGGTRHSAVMANAAAPLDEAEMAQMARYFAKLPGLTDRLPAGDSAAARIVRDGLPDKQLPACAACHAPGKPYPRLTGQRASYIAQRLRQWRGEETVVDARKPQDSMAVIARRIPEDMIDPLARHLAGQ